MSFGRELSVSINNGCPQSPTLASIAPAAAATSRRLSRSRTGANGDGGGSLRRRDRHGCVLCKASRPKDGKILQCLHVMCATCLDFELSTEGSVRCEVCRYESKPPIASVPLRCQLSNADELLYPGLKTVANNDAGSEDDGDTTELQVYKYIPIKRASTVIVMCDWCDDAIYATHECLECNGAGMCVRHVQGHALKHAFRDHQPRRLALSGDDPKPVRQNSDRTCRLHVGTRAEHYCRDCHHVVCWRCLAAGHRAHKILTLGEVAKAFRSDFEGLLVGSDKQRAMLQAHTKFTTIQIETAHMEIGQAAEDVRSAFARLQKILEDSERKHLDEIGEHGSKHLQPLSELRKRLSDMMERHDIATGLAHQLQHADLTGVGTCGLELADSVASTADEVRQYLDEFGTSHGQHETTLQAHVATRDAVTSVQSALESLVILRHSAKQRDQGRFTVHVNPPDLAYSGQTFTVLVAITCCSVPSFEFDDALLMVNIDLSDDIMDQQPDVDLFLSDVSDTKALLKVKITPVIAGRYRMSVGYDEDESCEVMVDVAPKPGFCTSANIVPLSISVSDDGRCASHKEADWLSLGHVFGNWAHCHGQVAWDLRVTSQFMAYGNVSVGVALGLPQSQIKDNLQEWASKNAYFWQSTGETRCSLGVAQNTSARTSPWMSGDTMTLTLDCRRRTLTLWLHRTGERKTLDDIIGMGQSLRLYAVLFDARDKIEIL